MRAARIVAIVVGTAVACVVIASALMFVLVVLGVLALNFGSSNK